MFTEEVVRRQLDILDEEGAKLMAALCKQETDADAEPFEFGYQRWYSRALPLMQQLAPDRYAEFQAFYQPDPSASWIQPGGYGIQDYFLGRDFEHEEGYGRGETARCFTSQLAILSSVADRLEWQQLDTEDQAGRSLQLGVLETARDLIKVSERAAGALAGTVLAAHLKQLAAKHELKLRKQSSSLRELADALKAAKVLDVPAWSQATWLAEIRGRCLKAEGEAPTKLQIRDLVDGTHWMLTHVF
jgi:hypothetical protein